MITSSDLLQETLAINVLTALKSSLEHRCKDILGSTLDNVCSVHRRVFSTWEGGGGGGDFGDVHEYIGGCTVHRGFHYKSEAFIN